MENRFKTMKSELEYATDIFYLPKLKMPFLIASIFTPLVAIIEKYIFADWHFVIFLAIMITLDTVTGWWKHWKKGTFSSLGFSGVFTKVVIYGIFLIVIHGLGHFSEKEFVRDVFSWIDQLCYGALIVREGISVIENLGAIKPGLIPDWILKRLKQFDEEGNFNGNR